MKNLKAGDKVVISEYGTTKELTVKEVSPNNYNHYLMDENGQPYWNTSDRNGAFKRNELTLVEQPTPAPALAEPSEPTDRYEELDEQLEEAQNDAAQLVQYLTKVNLDKARQERARQIMIAERKLKTIVRDAGTLAANMNPDLCIGISLDKFGECKYFIDVTFEAINEFSHFAQHTIVEHIMFMLSKHDLAQICNVCALADVEYINEADKL
jgi:hypothetical protein